MKTSLFLQGWLIGFTLAAVVGPIALLSIQRTLTRGWIVGLFSGLGIASADGLYGLAGALGLSVITNFLVDQQAWLRGIGGVALLYLGVRILTSPSESLEVANQQEAQPRHDAGSLLGAYSTMLLLTLSNPATILAFAAIFAGLSSFGSDSSLGASLTFALSVFLGSFSWWLILASLVNLLRSRFNPRVLFWVNRLSGGLIALFGAVVLVSLFSLPSSS